MQALAHRAGRRVAAAGIALVTSIALLAGCTPATTAPQPQGTRDAGILLFQWTWNAIADECEHLGEAGIDWVLTSPPQEHVVRDEWWVHYQPVSYRIESRLGTRDEFAAMVSTCAEHDVDIVADAVVNHMTGLGTAGVGWAGSDYEHYAYPGIWGPDDFHQCTESPTGDIIDYRNADEVRYCELVNLADLATGTERVREGLRAYLDDLLSLGVAGFRIDAAKHMEPADITAITAGLPDEVRVYQEVIRASGEPIQPEDYLDNGPSWEFLYARTVKSMVDSGALNPDVVFGPDGGSVPSELAISFVDNHDTERNGETLSYKDGDRYLLALAFLLAHPYGTPQLMSGYAFEGRDAAPPLREDGRVVDASCEFANDGPQPRYEPGEWVCPHRWTGVEGMLAFRSAVGEAPLTDSVRFDGDLRALSGFGRGEYGYIAFNAGPLALTSTFETSLRAGTYTDVLSGTAIEVDDDGRFAAEVPGNGFVALHVGAVER
ncbi:alpha-amylase [Microcella putealis]|uniref:Alpha-amylase n=1 Tax=Microcella putealis TaxID=337005 RepID=A0A4Q7LGC9_9MICO|nr:alpha-amylase family protein [Microcella putealis]RZS53516.1 alpha-amylase [Microcella putealis]TQM26960.1 alpha-amylase [Microcella putealis]